MKNLGILAILLTNIGIQAGCSSDRIAGIPSLPIFSRLPDPPSVGVPPPIPPCNKENEKKENEKKEQDDCLPLESDEANTTE